MECNECLECVECVVKFDMWNLCNCGMFGMCKTSQGSIINTLPSQVL